MPKPYTYPTLLNEALQLSITKLKEWEYLNPEQYKSGTINWSRNEQPTGSISIQVFNLKGQLVQESSQSAIGRSLEIELDQLSLGTYILKVETEIGAEVVKVVRSNYE